MIVGICALLAVGTVATAVIFYLSLGPRSQKAEKISPAPVARPSIRLQGTSVDQQGAVALVDGEILKVGQTVEGYRIEAIEKNRILLSKGSLKQWLDREGNFVSASE